MVEESSIEMNDLMFLALDHAVASIEGSDQLIPFAMTINQADEKSLNRFALELLEQGLDAAKKHVESQKDAITTYAIAWDGVLTLEGKRWDAIFVEAGASSSAEGVLIAQRYEKNGFFKKRNQPVGNPALVEKPISRIVHT